MSIFVHLHARTDTHKKVKAFGPHQLTYWSSPGSDALKKKSLSHTIYVASVHKKLHEKKGERERERELTDEKQQQEGSDF